MSPRIKNILALLPLALGLAVSVIFVFFIGAESLVDYIGIQNAYLLMFLVAALGGLSTFNSVPYLAVLVVLANTGVNPLLLGITSACGVMCGDSFSYFLGRQGGAAIPVSFRPMFTYISGLASNKPRVFLVICFFYGAFCPLSNDFVTIASGAAQISYKKVMAPLALGNVFFSVLVAYLAVYSYDSIQSLVG